MSLMATTQSSDRCSSHGANPANISSADTTAEASAKKANNRPVSYGNRTPETPSLKMGLGKKRGLDIQSCSEESSKKRRQPGDSPKGNRQLVFDQGGSLAELPPSCCNSPKGQGGAFGSTFLTGGSEAGGSCKSEAAKPTPIEGCLADLIKDSRKATRKLRDQRSGGKREAAEGRPASSATNLAGFGSSFEFGISCEATNSDDDTASTASRDEVRGSNGNKQRKPLSRPQDGREKGHQRKQRAGAGNKTSPPVELSLFPVRMQGEQELDEISSSSETTAQGYKGAQVSTSASKDFWAQAKRWRSQVGSVIEMCGESCGSGLDPQETTRTARSDSVAEAQKGLLMVFSSFKGWPASEGRSYGRNWAAAGLV